MPRFVESITLGKVAPIAAESSAAQDSPGDNPTNLVSSAASQLQDQREHSKPQIEHLQLGFFLSPLLRRSPATSCPCQATHLQACPEASDGLDTALVLHLPPFTRRVLASWRFQFSFPLVGGLAWRFGGSFTLHKGQGFNSHKSKPPTQYLTNVLRTAH